MAVTQILSEGLKREFEVIITKNEINTEIKNHKFNLFENI